MSEPEEPKEDKNKRVEMKKLDPELRKRNFDEVTLGYTDEEVQREARRCLLCKKEPKCILNCPAKCNIRDFVKPVIEGNYEVAMASLLKDTPIPGTLGRVCPHWCTRECLRGKKGDPISISYIKRFVADRVDRFKLGIQAAQSTGKRVAVIGSGPAGLTVAYKLRLWGHSVDVFEELPVLGGMLAVGIPEYRLPRKVLNEEIDFIKHLGVNFYTNRRVESVEELQKQGFHAVFIGVGAHLPQKLNVPGEELKGVIHATPFLRDVNLGKKVELGKKVAVIGGGNVAIDAVRTSLRLGADQAFIVYRRSIQEMPADPMEIEETQEEGVKIHFLAAPVKILGTDNVTGMECIRMELGETDSSGRRRPIPIKGSEFVIELDNVIPAISQTPDLGWASKEGLKLSKWGSLVVDEATGCTKVKGVYAGGDDIRGPATVIEAIADGNRAANGMHEYLTGGG